MAPPPTLAQYNNYVFNKMTTRTPPVLNSNTQTNQDYPLLRRIGRNLYAPFRGQINTSVTSDGQRVRYVERYNRGQINNLMRNLGRVEGEAAEIGQIYSYDLQEYVFYSDDVAGYNPGNLSNFETTIKSYHGPSSENTQGDRIRRLRLRAQLQNFRPTKR